MRKMLLTGAIMLFSFLGKSQFTHSDVIYYVGEGPDTAFLVIDFQDDTPDSSFAWGYLFDATATAEDMITAIAADEEYLTVDTEGGFLNDVIYNAHEGIGFDPDFWGTWSRTEDTDWELNDGLSEELSNGDWFGCSYTDFDPAVAPGEPIAAYESAKFTELDVQFWVGTGENEAVFVIDFVEDVYGEAVTYAWGYRFDGTTDGGTMLADIDEADVNLEVDAGDFLNDIIYNDMEGLAGDPYWWGTWSGTNLTDWVMNLGLSTPVNDGDWFGCTYAAWPPRRPFYPIAALDSAAYTIDEVDFIVGSGENKAVIVIDFNEWFGGESFAFGYAFEGETATAEEALEELGSTALYALTIDMDGGFLNDIVYSHEGGEVFSGIGGDPYFWGTWSADNVGGWVTNTGIGEELSDGDWFACSYTSWAPATPPSYPTNGYSTAGIEENANNQISIYPNPASDFVNLNLNEDAFVQVTDLQGRVVVSAQYQQGITELNVADLESGVYFVIANLNGEIAKQKLVVE